MHAIQTQELALMHFSHVGDDGARCDAAWPVHGGQGAAGSAAVYFELEPGARLGRHTDSAEEVLIVLEGEVDALVGAEQARVRAGGLAVVPAMEPHDVVNTGRVRARVTGVFAAGSIVATFDDPFAQTGGRVVGTPAPAQAATA